MDPLGLRSLAPESGGTLLTHYRRGLRERALAHEGTAWLWLLGPFVEDWVRVRGGGRSRLKAGGPRMLPGPAPPAPGQRDSLKSVGQGTRIAQRLSWFLGLQVPLPEVCQG